MNKQRIDEIKSILIERLTKENYNHCFNVAEFAYIIANKVDVDTEKIYIAGLLHDVAKELSDIEILDICEKTNKYLTKVERNNPRSLHGLASASIAFVEFNIKDPCILRTIAYHSGRVALTKEEKVLFIANGIELNKKHGFDSTRILEMDDLDSAIIELYWDVEKVCRENNFKIKERKRDCFNYIFDIKKQKYEENGKKGSALLNETYEIIDKSIDVYISHRLSIESVKNIRDFGDYLTKNNKKIRKNLLIRSGSLDTLTKDDSNKLKELGVNCIIDLRNPHEIKHFDKNIDGFKYYNCPLPTIEVEEVGKRYEDFILSSTSDEEKAWYTKEYLFYVDIIKMYKDILTLPKSIMQMRKIFNILIDDSINGVLLHCVSGKDRTGIIVMFIQHLLGMKKEDMILDYYASALPNYLNAEGYVYIIENNGYSNELFEITRELVGLGEYLISSIEKWWNDNNYGSIDNYLKEILMIDTKKIGKIRKKYLIDD